MTSKQESFPGRSPRCSSSSGMVRRERGLSELLPRTAKIADDICVVRSMFTEAINHDPAITFFQTGFQLGRPAEHRFVAVLRTWACDNDDLPAFVAMVSGEGGQPLYDRLWGSGFLPTKYQGGPVSLGPAILFCSCRTQRG